MPVFQMDCPHCRTKKIAAVTRDSIASQKYVGTLYAFATCTECSEPVIAHFIDLKWMTGKATDGRTDVFNRLLGNLKEASFDYVGTVPNRIEGDDLLFVPKEAKAAFDEGVICINNGVWNAAGMSFRRAIDVGTRRACVDNELESTSKLALKKRLEGMRDDALITSSLFDVLDHVRLEGNSANHELDPYTETEAKQLRQVTELVLIYLFTLPGRVNIAQVSG